MKNKAVKSDIYTFRTIIEPDKPSGYHGFVPRLKGVHTQGETIEETAKNLKEAIICHLQVLLEEKENIPQEEETLEAIQVISQKELSLQK